MSKIEEKIDKYLNEAKREEEYNKLVKTLKSIQTKNQIDTAIQMILKYSNKYKDSFWDNFFTKREREFRKIYREQDISLPLYRKLFDRLEQLEFEGKLKGGFTDELRFNMGIDG